MDACRGRWLLSLLLLLLLLLRLWAADNRGLLLGRGRPRAAGFVERLTLAGRLLCRSFLHGSGEIRRRSLLCQLLSLRLLACLLLLVPFTLIECFLVLGHYFLFQLPEVVESLEGFCRDSVGWRR